MADQSVDVQPVDPKVVTARKTAPPETREAIWTRNLVVFSFWAVVIFLGLPVWLWTTSIHRANLPLQEMLEWSEMRVIETPSACATTAC